MGGFGFVIAVGLAIYALVRSGSLSTKLESFEIYIKSLEARIKQLEKNDFVPTVNHTLVAAEEVETIETGKIEMPPLPFVVTEYYDEEIEGEIDEEMEDEIEEEPSIQYPTAPIFTGEMARSVAFIATDENKISKSATVSEPRVATISQEKNNSEWWSKVEKQFVENWTGILGSVIMVIGVGFLGIYTAISISALGRFLMISGFSGLLVGLFFYLHKKPQWTQLALWMRSSAGAIFLFACAASVSIPGLKWAESQAMQLSVLSLGVIANLFLGYIGKNQGLASLHVLLSLVAVCIIPPSSMLMIITAIVTLFGVVLTYREKWDYHLLLTATSFFIFQLFFRFSADSVILDENRIIGLVTVFMVGLAVTLVHYRQAYSKTTFARVPFVVHLFNWFYFGIGLSLYSDGSQYATFALGTAAVAIFFLARRAKKLEIRWLYITDTLIAQLTTILALISLSRWELDKSIVLAFVFIEGLLFLLVSKKEKDALLYTIGSVAISIIGIIALGFSISLMFETNTSLFYKQVGALLTTALSGTAYLYYIHKTNSLAQGTQPKLGTKHHLLSIVLGGIFVSYYIHLFEFNWSVFSVVALLIAVLYLRNKIQSFEFNLISIIFLIGAHLVNWVALYKMQDQSSWQILMVGLPILVASAFTVKYSFVSVISKYLNWIGVYLFSIQLTLLAYFLVKPVSVLAVSSAWLLLSWIAVLIFNIISKKTSKYHQVDRYILHVGYALIGLFLIQHIFVNLSIQDMWGPIKGRIWVGVSALFVFVCWAITKNEGKTNYTSWRYIHPLMVELIMLFSVLTVSVEIHSTYLPMAYLGVASMMLAFSWWKNKTIGRLAFYSFGLFLVSLAVELIVYRNSHGDLQITSAFQTEMLVLASAFIVFALSYLIVYYKRAQLDQIRWPYLIFALKPVGGLLIKSAAFIGVYSFGAFFMLLSYYMFQPISLIIPAVIWLLLSAIIATVAILSYQKRSNFMYVDRFMLQLSYWFIVAFVIRHVLVHIQIESYVGIFKIRFLIEGLALLVFAYCATLKKPEAASYRSWTYLHPLLIELFILFSVFTVALEVDAIWQPLIWVGMSFVFAFIANSTYTKLSRLLFYSLVMYWVAALQTAFVISSYAVPSSSPLAQAWVYGSISLLFQFAFLIYFYSKSSLHKMSLPKPLIFLNGAIDRIHNNINTYVFYPLIICTAMFLFWTFDKSVLTLLWVIECLLVFVISIVLKKQHFRYVALGALAICIVRLIFFDLSQSSTLTRALVFLSVGVIMLIMNSLYNKFKSRFE